jgi:hypothetical protein
MILSMKQKRRESKRQESHQFRKVSVQEKKNLETVAWPGERFRPVTFIGIALIAFSTLIIYGQTLRVQPFEYEDTFYLVHSPYVDSAQSGPNRTLRTSIR